MANTKITTNVIADDAVTSAKLDTNISVAGTLASTGVLTANAGVVVDNITIDGTEIDLSSGDLTIDVAGDIILDADGGTISLKDGGTQFGFLEKGGSDKLSIKATIQDADIAFFGNDGGSEVTALTLDMSAAGAATFNSNVNLPDSAILQLGDSQDFQAYHAGGSTYLKNDTGTLIVRADSFRVLNNANSEQVFHADANGAVTLYYDNSAKFATTSTGVQLDGILLSNANGTGGTKATLAEFTSSGSIRSILLKGAENTANQVFLDVVRDINGTETTLFSIADGKVGIGDTSPSAQLHIKTDVATGSGGSADYSSGTNMSLYIENSSGGYPRIFHKSGSSSVASVTNCESGKDMYWGEPTDTGTYYFRGRKMSIGGLSPISDATLTVDGGDMMVHGANNSAGVSDLLSGYTRGDYGVFYSTANTIYFRIASSYVSYIASNGTYNVSDERLKENVATLTGTLDKVKQLRGVSHTWKDTEEKGTDTVIGMIAQEVETVYPELVGDGGLPNDNAGNAPYKSINYAHLTSVLVEAVKELSTKLEAAEARIKTLEDA